MPTHRKSRRFKRGNSHHWKIWGCQRTKCSREGTFNIFLILTRTKTSIGSQWEGKKDREKKRECVREREREREKESVWKRERKKKSVWERERKRVCERERERECVWERVKESVWEREIEKVQNRYIKESKEGKSDNFCYRKVGTKWGAFEKSFYI